MCVRRLTGRSTRTRSSIAPQGVLVSVHPAAQCRCVPVNSDVRPHMTSFARSCLLCLTLLAPVGYAAAPDQSLTGCWRTVRIVLYAQDGSKTEESSGRCALRFEDDRLESTCATATGKAITTYQYRIDRPHVYLATMTGSTFRTSLVGTTREYEYHVDGDRLVTVATSQVISPGAQAVAPRVESEAARMPCH